MRKILILLYLLKGFNADIMPIINEGGDEHGCITDGGYEWCETNNQCQRNWEQPCIVSDVNHHYCSSSNIQACNRKCDIPECPNDKCAMRVGNCCDYVCMEDIGCPEECPPPIPCPLPLLQGGCQYMPPLVNNCGCSSGCGTIDCSRHHLLNPGEECGPYTNGICGEGYECVYNIDSVRTCQPTCENVRDHNGNCVNRGCSLWFDGCNTCIVNDKEKLLECSNELCNTKDLLPTCVDPKGDIPNNCLTWYDGCNTCSVNNGVIQGCTLMMCFTKNEPYCEVFTTNRLIMGDICYRYCEDGSQNRIDRQNDCPSGTKCFSKHISNDYCGTKVKVCLPNSYGH